MYKMNNSLQHYAWGSKTALSERFGIPNPTALPIAEVWMGAHPKSSSSITVDGERRALREVIDEQPTRMLGEAVAARFGELPFLFKVLSAAQPLSIQVHPAKAAAEAGFARENAAGIPLDAPERNYKDANHKPELVYALTPFQAMNGFRERHEMVALLATVAGAHPQIAHFLETPSEANLAALFSALLCLDGSEKSRALAILHAARQTHEGEPWQTLNAIAEVYPDDNGLFSPLLLNVVTLQPGEAMFLDAETPHAYLHGVALEIMASSDNVLRAGLTAKFMDVPELLANLAFHAKPADRLRLAPHGEGDTQLFPVPVDDFSFSVHTLHAAPHTLHSSSAAVLFCIEGEATLTRADRRLTLRPGESCFVPADDAPVQVSGHGRLARAFNDLH
ncbi:mannose-6-phosphate isomerase [Pantoea eucrina]|uniref:mannose-6-phosphate isomerase n=1 Tax=Pantoea eucrina TaxID=472693 RepID=A0ABU5LF18_9GAMM|nr:mannose-6-phosphate isomerase [Pantoea eucrina]MDZ7278507.1 mannose-6-phosphate isomerase [Pantoea eucrina]